MRGLEEEMREGLEDEDLHTQWDFDLGSSLEGSGDIR
jgi:hypothetical protein